MGNPLWKPWWTINKHRQAAREINNAARKRDADDAGLHAGESEPKKVCRPPAGTVSIAQQEKIQIQIDTDRYEAIARKEKRKLDAMRVQHCHCGTCLALADIC